jgi:GNAT superfamily N-acetyltransferase
MAKPRKTPTKTGKTVIEAGQPGPQPKVKLEIQTRLATVLDVVALLGLLYHYFDDLKFAYPQIDPADAIEWGLSLIKQNLVIVALADNRLIGSIGMERGTFPWNKRFSYLNGVWFYVSPERRAGGTAGKLMQIAKDMAAANKLALRLDNIWGIEPELQDRFRQQHGFTYVGGNHVWFPPPPDAPAPAAAASE